MSTKKIATSLVSLGLVLTLSLSACGSSSQGQSDTQSGSSQSTAVDSTVAPKVDRDPAGPLPTFTGAIGEMPVMTPVTDDPPAVISVQTLVEGDGAEIGPDDYIKVNYAGFLWDGTAFDSSWSRSSTYTTSLNQVVLGWKYGLAGTHVGDRVVVVIPPEYGYGDTGSGELIPAGATLVFVVDVLKQEASVTVDELKAATDTGAEIPAGLTLNGALGEEVSMTFETDAVAPTEAKTIVLAEGSGPVITDADSVFYHMVGAYWGSTDVQSSWADGFQQMPTATADIVGYKVGTRLLLITPASGTDTPASTIVVDLAGAFAPDVDTAQSE